MKLDISTKNPVLVTGGNGYVGSWVVQKLLDKGLTVHVTVRDIKSDIKTSHLQKMSDESKGTIKFFQADLLDEGSFEAPMKNCETVFHTAAPFNWKYSDAEKDFYKPVVEGTKNVLEAVNKTKTVKTVIYTSSGFAIYGDNADISFTPNGALNEDCWNTTCLLYTSPSPRD